VGFELYQLDRSKTLMVHSPRSAYHTGRADSAVVVAAVSILDHHCGINLTASPRKTVSLSRACFQRTNTTTSSGDEATTASAGAADAPCRR
jgi:hypothetical protein